MTALAMIETPVSPRDPVNRQILEVSEDRVRGFVRDPMRTIAELSGVAMPVVVERIRAMLAAGTIRRVRQTLLATNLAQGALIAWKIDETRTDAAFDYIAAHDPFSGHVVIRNGENGRSEWRLWTTLKVPAGFSVETHCNFLRQQIGAETYRVMPVLRAFVLGVGHMRRKGMKIGEMSPEPAKATQPAVVDLTEREWNVLSVLKADFAPNEIGGAMWENRALAAGIRTQTFFGIAEDLDRRGVIGRFSTFLEHTKPVADNERLSSFNGLFHWAVPPGREIEAGCEIGRFAILTHCYWRDGGPDLNGVNIMAVAHGETKDDVMAHKAAIDAHLIATGIGFTYTNVYWGGRAEIKPSEISPAAYRQWARTRDLL
ncbi:MAG: Lrp/AsnC family transcriptional regulator [Acidobacteria bacterium]|nr:Lrp/AsnC family transcriptional regulator [Acidobacteriota bacterium]MBV9067176.1 Lrp/AsnC family transcriptional regulator [Acidobacteriota bacterium]MBV9184564.1 Lrp/AsnC family transcriptional regulator [Acidobacteriota bacterium]